MVKPWEMKRLFPTDSDVWLNAFGSVELHLSVINRGYDRREIQDLVAELMEWLIETAPKTEVSKSE